MSGGRRLLFRGVFQADRAAGSVDCHGRRALSRLARFHEAGDLAALRGHGTAQVSSRPPPTCADRVGQLRHTLSGVAASVTPPAA